MARDNAPLDFQQKTLCLHMKETNLFSLAKYTQVEPELIHPFVELLAHRIDYRLAHLNLYSSCSKLAQFLSLLYLILLTK